MQHKNALVVRNLTPKFPYSERDQLLYGLAATTVHNSPNHSIAFFSRGSDCQLVIRLLHQRILFSKRLRVEYAPENLLRRLNCHTVQDASLQQQISSDTKEHLGPSLPQDKSYFNLDQLESLYRFPKASTSIIRRIGQQLLRNEKFYYFVLLLMIQLNIEPPFDEDNHGDDLWPQQEKHDLSGDESEMETADSSLQSRNYTPEFLLNQRKHKRVKLTTGILDSSVVPTSKHDKPPPPVTTNIEQVFERSDLLKPVLSIKVSSTLAPVEEKGPALAEGFGVIEVKPEEPKPAPKEPHKSRFDLATLNLDEIVSDTQLISNRIPESEYNQYSVFKTYTPGVRSHRLYIKNIDRKTTTRQLYCLFAKFIDLGRQTHLDSFDIVYLDKGRMRGQAFVTFPNEDTCQTALEQTNGYLFGDKPIVVAYARSCKPSDV